MKFMAIKTLPFIHNQNSLKLLHWVRFGTVSAQFFFARLCWCCLISVYLFTASPLVCAFVLCFLLACLSFAILHWHIFTVELLVSCPIFITIFTLVVMWARGRFQFKVTFVRNSCYTMVHNKTSHTYTLNPSEMNKIKNENIFMNDSVDNLWIYFAVSFGVFVLYFNILLLLLFLAQFCLVMVSVTIVTTYT